MKSADFSLHSYNLRNWFSYRLNLFADVAFHWNRDLNYRGKLFLKSFFDYHSMPCWDALKLKRFDKQTIKKKKRKKSFSSFFFEYFFLFTFIINIVSNISSESEPCGRKENMEIVGADAFDQIELRSGNLISWNKNIFSW